MSFLFLHNILDDVTLEKSSESVDNNHFHNDNDMKTCWNIDFTVGS